MRFIRKNSEPKEFSEWKSKSNEEWQATYSDLSGSVKNSVYQSLLSEQGHLCCYCERELKENDYHIDHLAPQHQNPENSLDYSNLLCSCLKQTAKGDPLHCGKLKDNRFIPIHPLQEDCQTKFIFTAIGEIDGIDEDAKNTILVLGLNITKLISMRKAAVSPFLSEELDNDEFISFVNGYLSANTNGRRNAFSSMIEFLFQNTE